MRTSTSASAARYAGAPHGVAAMRRIGARLILALAAFGCGLGLFLMPAPAAAQARAGVARIGLLWFGSRPMGDPVLGFRRGLRERGYVEGQDIVVEQRFADGRPERLPVLAAELVQLKVDVIVAGGPAPLKAAAHATTTIPIVALSGSDPVREGWAQSLARPGGNVTGLTVTYPELGPKRLELLKAAVPGLVRVALMLAPDDMADAREALQEVRAAAQRLGMQLLVLEVRGANDIDAAFASARQWRAQALLAFATNTVVTHRERTAALAVHDQLPSISDFPPLAQAGFLMSYGADLDELARRAAGHVDKILRGARPGELPIERPTKFQLSVNLRTAKALGIELPRSLLLRADEVLQ